MDTSKIIKGAVSSGRYTVTAPIVKEDYGLYLQIEGVELPSTYEVDFSNSEHHGTSVTMIGNADGVLIPSQFISSGKDVFAFLYHVGADYGRTVYKFRIPNKVRPDRTDETPTPEEQSVIDQAIGALNDAVAQTAQDVISADQSARSAQGYAEQAESARDTAQGYASNAQLSATQANNSAISANQSASASAQSASQSAQIKADVEDLADDAQGYAQASAQSASASANSASQAQGFAQSASASANSASGYASQADISANTASNKASEASTSAQTASTKATESAQSASQALSYKTDAESAKTASQTAQGLAESARDTAVSAKTDAESARDDAESARDEAQQAVASIGGALDDKAPVITDTASGAIASFTDGADNLPLKSLIVNIDPVQDLSQGDPSPTNICPISGWTEINTYNDPLHGGSIEWNQYVENADFADGINKWTIVGTSTPSDYISVDNGVATVNMLGTQNNMQIANKNGSIKAVIGHKYYYKIFIKSSAWASSGNKIIAHIGGYWAKAISTALPVNEWVEISFIFDGISVSQNLDAGLRKYADENYSPFQIKDFVLCDLTKMFGAGNEPSTVEEFKALFPADYYPYNEGEKTTVSAVNGKPYTHVNIQLGQTVYGGKLDVLSGELMVDRANIASYNGETLPSTWISDRDVYASGTTPTTGAQVVYQLATPLEIQLSPNQINSLYGVNNIWADSGDTEVVYRADTKAYIAKKIAEAISALS